jgi:AcrR family transcriptional regulator
MTLPADAPTLPLSPKQRRERNRREMVDAILAAARAVMREHGVAALNLNEVARRVQLRPQSLAEYFPSKAALYDELFRRAVHLFHDGDAHAYREHPPGWGQIEAWFANRIALAYEHPDLYHLVFSAPVPDLQPTGRTVDATRETLAGARRMVAAAIAAGAMAPGMAPERVTDLLMAIRHGLIAEHLGKQAVMPAGSERFSGLVPDFLRTLQAAWAPAPRPGGGGA